MGKTIIITIAILCFACLNPACAEDAPNAADGKNIEGSSSSKAVIPAGMNEKDALNAKDPVKEYGTGASPKDMVKISEVLENPDKFLDKEITVSGLIVDVCPKRGCWMMFASDKKFQTLRIKVNDGEMVFPLSARGHEGFARGKLAGNQLSQEQTVNFYKHLAEEKGEQFDASTVKGPATIYMLRATGAVIK